MAEANKLALIMNPERIMDEFGKKDVIRNKIQQLKGSVFRNYNVRKSKAVFHSNTSPTRPHTYQQSPSTAEPRMEKSRVKNIEFRVSSSKSESNPRRSSNSFNPRVASSFTPRVFMHPHKTAPSQRQD